MAQTLTLSSRSAHGQPLSYWVGRGLIYFALIVGAVVVLIPFIWMLVSSIKPPADILVYPPEWIPRTVRLENYTELFEVAPFGRYILNTAVITGLSIVGQVVSSALVGYGFARMRFPGRDILFTVMIGTIIIPFEVTVIPNFILFTKLGWRNTILPLVVPTFFGAPFFIFLFRQFFKAIPGEFADAARIDGAGELAIFWRIWMPLSRPAIATCTIFTFVGTWNDYLRPLIFLTDQKNQTISIGLAAFQGYYVSEWHYIMAGSVLAMLPVLIVFFFAQRLFIEGAVISGLKG